MIVADGAVWIWKLAGDRFAQAHQRLDYYQWSRAGDEALMGLETLWRKGRWSQLYPHVGDFDPSGN